MYMLMTFHDHVARVTLLHTVAHCCTWLHTVIVAVSYSSFLASIKNRAFWVSPLRRARCSEVGACGYIASSNRRFHAPDFQGFQNGSDTDSDRSVLGGPSLLLQLQSSNWWRLKCEHNQWNAAHEFSWVPGYRSRPRKSTKCFEPVWCQKLFQRGTGKRTLCCEFVRSLTQNAMICNDMQWYAMICNGLNNCICTHTHTQFSKNARCFWNMHISSWLSCTFWLFSSIFFIASFHPILRKLARCCLRTYWEIRASGGTGWRGRTFF